MPSDKKYIRNGKLDTTLEPTGLTVCGSQQTAGSLVRGMSFAADNERDCAAFDYGKPFLFLIMYRKE